MHSVAEIGSESAGKSAVEPSFSDGAGRGAMPLGLRTGPVLDGPATDPAPLASGSVAAGPDAEVVKAQPANSLSTGALPASVERVAEALIEARATREVSHLRLALAGPEDSAVEIRIARHGDAVRATLFVAHDGLRQDLGEHQHQLALHNESEKRRSTALHMWMNGHRANELLFSFVEWSRQVKPVRDRLE